MAQLIGNERVDDIPLLLSQMEKLNVRGLADEHFKGHGNWQGLSLGEVMMGWLSYLLSQGDHRLNQVEAWASGMKPIASHRVNMKQTMVVCPPLGWAKWDGLCPPPGNAKMPAPVAIICQPLNKRFICSCFRRKGEECVCYTPFGLAQAVFPPLHAQN